MANTRAILEYHFQTIENRFDANVVFATLKQKGSLAQAV